MKASLQARREILSAAQAALWPQLAPTRALGYVLYGGTAIALRLGHRASEDFDFFTQRPLDQHELRRALPFLNHAMTLQESADTLTVMTLPPSPANRGVKVSFFAAIDFGRIGMPDCTDDGILQVASLDDLMATKLKVILQRVEVRDYRDIAAMIEANVDLAHGMAGARRMFGNSFQPSESLKALTWFQDGDLELLSAGEQRTLIDAASRVRDLPVVELSSRTLRDPAR